MLVSLFSLTVPSDFQTLTKTQPFAFIVQRGENQSFGELSVGGSVPVQRQDFILGELNLFELMRIQSLKVIRFILIRKAN